MKRKLTAVATVAVLALSAAAPMAHAMNDQLNALTGAVYSALNKMQMDLANINDLTLDDIHRINLIMSNGDTESEKRNAINQILREAAAR